MDADLESEIAMGLQNIIARSADTLVTKIQGAGTVAVAGSTKSAVPTIGRDVLQLSQRVGQAASAPPNLAEARAQFNATLGQAVTENQAALAEMMNKVRQASTTAEAQAHFDTFFQGLVEQVLPKIDPSLDIAAGQASLTEELTSTPVFTQDPALQGYVQGVLEKLKAAGKTRYDHQVTLLDTAAPNAANTGGPSMVVNTGFLPTMQNEAQLAGILAHEITHGELRHGVQGKLLATVATAMLPFSSMTSAPRTVIDYISKARSTFTPEHMADPDFLFKQLPQSRFGQGYAYVTNAMQMQAVLMGAMRGFERQADEGAVRLMSKAGYDPEALAALFKALPVESQTPSVQLMARLYDDHPPSPERSITIQQQIDAEQLKTGLQTVNRVQFAKATASVRGTAPKAA